MTLRLRIVPLSDEHDRRDFECGTGALDSYLRERATQDIKRRVSNCFAMVDDDNRIAGYYTFAATGIALTDLTEADRKRLPRYPLVPGGLIGRLAIDRRFQGQRLGGAMIADAAARAARADPAIFALIVDAKDEAAAGFYRHLGFNPFASRPTSLYLPVATALKAQQT